MAECIRNFNFQTEIIIDGKSYFHSPAHQLAEFVCKQKYEEFRLTYFKGFTSSNIYIERILSHGGYFISSRFEEKKSLGTLFFDVEKKIMTFRKSEKKSNMYGFQNSDELKESFFIHNEIFKYLRSCDVIQILVKERTERRKAEYFYSITKGSALKAGYVKYAAGYGMQFVIPKKAFIRVQKQNYR